MNIAVIEFSKNTPEIDSQSAMTFRTEIYGFNFRFRFHWFGFFVTFTDIDLDDLEVLDVGDQVISIFINTLENVFSHIIGTFDSQEAISGVDELGKFFKSHHSFFSF